MFLIQFVPKITFNLAYNLVVDEENEKEQKENPESQVQLLKQVFRQNFHLGVEVYSFFFQFMSSPSKFKAPSFPDGTCHHSFSFASNFARSI